MIDHDKWPAENRCRHEQGQQKAGSWAPQKNLSVWTGARYAMMSNVELSSGVYWERQNNYLAGPAACTGSDTATSSVRCAGGRYSYSFLIDYLPVPRVNLYAGLLVSNVWGGVASGYQHAQNFSPTVGMRFRF
jgi:hypothetical protein